MLGVPRKVKSYSLAYCSASVLFHPFLIAIAISAIAPALRADLQTHSVGGGNVAIFLAVAMPS